MFDYHVRGNSIGRTSACDCLIGIEVGLDDGKYLVEVPCIELEDAVAPVLSLQLAIHQSIGNGPSDHIFIEIETHVLLDATKQSKSKQMYF